MEVPSSTEESGGAPSGVASTGISIASARANESLLADRLFNDPWAGLFVAAAPSAVISEVPAAEHDPAEIEALIAFGGVCDFWFRVRTRFFDDYLQQASSHCPQVVLLAAGLDARAFRLDWPEGTHLFEIDLPEVFAFKEPILEREGARPRCERTTVAADLGENWSEPLIDAGFDPERRSVWLAEGLMLYLSSPQVAQLLHTIGDLSSVGSELAYEDGFVADDELKNKIVNTAIMQPAVATWGGGLEGNPVEWLEAAGWNARLDDVTDFGRSLGRDAPPHTAGAFLSATRR
jgi:methyltransferase (TIGR00027 family)